MDWYRTIVDSVKLFFVNVFLYVVFLEAYVFIFLLQRSLGFELPLFEVFFSWVATFVAIAVWTVMARFWYAKKKHQKLMVQMAVVSELPFILLLLVLWLLVAGRGAGEMVSGFLMLFGAYMVIFPAIFVAAKTHTERTGFFVRMQKSRS